MEVPYLPLKSWAKEEQPREILLLRGADSLALNELFAILLRSGVGGESALDLSRKILTDYHYDLNLLARSGVREFMNRYKGVGMAKAASIVAAMEIGRRRSAVSTERTWVVRSSEDAYQYLQSHLRDLDHEEFWAIFLNRGNRIKGCECLSSGGWDKTVIDVRMLFRSALEVKAAHMIVAHNHPGETLKPSVPDEEVTRKIFAAGKLLDIQLLDHLIISSMGYYSFADEGKLI